MQPTQFGPILLEHRSRTLVATINRPEAMNALNHDVLNGLKQLLAYLNQQDLYHIDATRALVLTGAGEKAFVAGADIRELQELDANAARAYASDGQAVLGGLEELRIPVIAAVQGYALGGGLELALCCDFIFAAESAKFGLPECTLGLIPGFGGTVRLPRRIGTARALEMTLSAQPLSASEAMQYGLVNKVMPAAELMPSCLKVADLIGSRAPLAVSAIKRSVLKNRGQDLVSALSVEASLFSDLFSTDDKKEGVSAFLEKRKALFHGR